MKAVLDFKHAHNQGRITLFTNQIFGVMTLPEQKTTAIIGPNNALVPVSGTHDEVTKIVQEAKGENKND